MNGFRSRGLGRPLGKGGGGGGGGQGGGGGRGGGGSRGVPGVTSQSESRYVLVPPGHCVQPCDPDEPDAAGVGRALGAKTAGGLRYRDYAFSDGYTFRQYADGAILIVRSPRSKGGQLLTADNPQTKRAWQAITDRIKSYRAGRTEAFTRAGLVAVETVLVALQPAPRRGKKREAAPPPPQEEEEAPSFPWLGVGIAAAVVAVVAALA